MNHKDAPKEVKHLVWHGHGQAFLQDTFGVQKSIKPCGFAQVFPFFFQMIVYTGVIKGMHTQRSSNNVCSLLLWRENVTAGLADTLSYT